MSRRCLLKQAAEELNLTQHYLRTEIKAGRLPYLMAGNRYILDLDQVEKFLADQSLQNMRNITVDEVIQYGQLRKCHEG